MFHQKKLILVLLTLAQMMTTHSAMMKAPANHSLVQKKQVSHHQMTLTSLQTLAQLTLVQRILGQQILTQVKRPLTIHLQVMNLLFFLTTHLRIPPL